VVHFKASLAWTWTFDQPQPYLSDARNRNVFAVIAVVDAPAAVSAVRDVGFGSGASNVVQPNLSAAATEAVTADKLSAVSESERVANDSCCDVGESIVTNGSPRVVITHFKASFSRSWTSNQPPPYFRDARN